MRTLQSVMDDLKAHGNESYLKTYIRHGVPADRTFGVSNANLKLIAKSIKGQQDLALELYATGNMDAMYLAGIIIDGAKMTREQLQSWANESHGIAMIANYTVAWPAIENKEGWNLALEWIESADAMIICSGWSTLSGIITVTPDDQLDLNKVSDLLDKIAKSINSAQNLPKSAMNTFVITVGCYVSPLLVKAKETAKQIGVVKVDMGDTACKIHVANDAIDKAAASGKLGVKRKTVRC